MTPVFLDFESRSRVPIEVGGHAYVADPTTEIVCGVAEVDGAVYAWSPWRFTLAGAHVTTGTDLPPPQVVEAALARGVAAHNAEGFERLVWAALGLPPVRWFDTMPRLRRRGLPGKLEAVAQAVLGEGKDKAGRAIMLKVCRPQRGRLVDPSPPVLSALVRYCAKDVRLIARLWECERLGEPHPDDPALEHDAATQARGCRVDREWLAELQAAERTFGDAAIARAGAHGVTPTMLRSPKALGVWFRERGVKLWDVKAVTMEWVAAREDVPPEAREVAEARLAAVRVTRGKLANLASSLVDDRLFGWAAYHSAHTGRWGGRGVQVQNLPKAPEGMPADVRPRDALGLGRITAPALGYLTRGCFVPSGPLFYDLDFASVEARAVLWLAGDADGLQAFATGDPYRRLAAQLFNCDEEAVTRLQRQVGKMGCLSAGFSGGSGAIERGCAKAQVDLTVAGITAESVVQAWRDAHPAVAGRRTGGFFGEPPRPARRGGWWKLLMRAIRRCVDESIPQAVGPLGFVRDGRHLAMILPSGRPMIYRNVRLESRVPRWGGEPRPVVVFDKPVKGGVMPSELHTPAAAENAASAVCRDLLVAGMLRLGDRFPVALHCHDSVLVEVADESEAAEVHHLMEQLPPWATGFPLKAEGVLRRRYA